MTDGVLGTDSCPLGAGAWPFSCIFRFNNLQDRCCLNSVELWGSRVLNFIYSRRFQSG
jgi:hypothetical protein